ncbi:MAG TPA: hypothetical protein VOA64_08140 [Candidatus Dormibacteraeota bacterium]|nr:hypothetical protein [Candidatus Dormibacteraeota bacterium]
MADSYTKESLCAGMLEEARSVAKYMREKVRPRLDGVLSPTYREILATGIFLRSLCWMETLARLDHVQDFQAVSTGTRFLLEACVDLVLINHDDDGKLSIKMSDWALSAKFAMSQELVKFYNARNESVPEQHEPLKFFYEANKSSIPSLRSKYWGGKHPQRWTNCQLLSDCQAADKLEPIRIPAELGMSLAAFHESEIRRLNWLVHGSGIAILRHAPEPWYFHTCSLGFNWSSDLAVLISTLTMKTLRLDEATEGMDSERNRLRDDRLAALFEQLKNETA